MPIAASMSHNQIELTSHSGHRYCCNDSTVLHPDAQGSLSKKSHGCWRRWRRMLLSIVHDMAQRLVRYLNGQYEYMYYRFSIGLNPLLIDVSHFILLEKWSNCVMRFRGTTCWEKKISSVKKILNRKCQLSNQEIQKNRWSFHRSSIAFCWPVNCLLPLFLPQNRIVFYPENSFWNRF